MPKSLIRRNKKTHEAELTEDEVHNEPITRESMLLELSLMLDANETFKSETIQKLNEKIKKSGLNASEIFNLAKSKNGLTLLAVCIRQSKNQE